MPQATMHWVFFRSHEMFYSKRPSFPACGGFGVSERHGEFVTVSSREGLASPNHSLCSRLFTTLTPNSRCLPGVFFVLICSNLFHNFPTFSRIRSFVFFRPRNESHEVNRLLANPDHFSTWTRVAEDPDTMYLAKSIGDFLG